MIKVYLKYFIFVLLGLFIQSAISKSVAFSPDFLFVLVIALSFSSQNVFGVILAFFLGLLSDLASGVYLGPFAAAYVCAFCFAGMISKRIFADRMFAIMSITFLSCIVKSVVFCTFIFYFVPRSASSFLNFKLFLTEAILTALISPIVFRIFLGKLFGKSKSSSITSFAYSRAVK